MKECPKCGLCYPDDVTVCSADASAVALSLPGERVLGGRYLLERRIGRGAMGQVYLAKDQKFANRRVAVKTVRQDLLSTADMQEGEAIARFEREAQAAASIQHPNTVSVTDFGESDNGIFFLVMEYVEGETLHKLLRREGTLPVKRAVALLGQIADGVEAAHEIGILHRDLKPANIFLLQTARQTDGFIKVGDFGLAKIVTGAAGGSSSEMMPSSRGIIGTPEFMAPEQMQPEVGVDRRADLYALGTIAYQMLAGKTPFTGDMMQLVMQKVMHKAPPLSSVRSDIPARIEQIVMQALETDAAARPPSVSAWIDALRDAAEHLGESEPDAGAAKLVVLAPAGAEVYVDDERRGSIGSSGRVVIGNIAPGRHILRVCRRGDQDDERVIEVRESSEDQLIQAQLRPERSGGAVSRNGSYGGGSALIPGIVECVACFSRFAEGVKFCGRCGGRAFSPVSEGESDDDFPCPRCFVALPGDSRFCSRCGLNINTAPAAPGNGGTPDFRTPGTFAPQAERVCPRCRSAYPAGVKFCGRCGTGLF